MKLHLLFFSVALLSIGIMPPAVAQHKSFSTDANPNQASAAPALNEERGSRGARFANPQSPITEIPRLSAIEHPLTNVEGLMQDQRRISQSPISPSPVVQVTGVRLNPTDTALEVILETQAGQPLQAETRTEGNTLIADIPNAVLALPERKEFRADNPVKGTVAVTVTQVDANRIQVRVTGEAAVPTVEVVPNAIGLVLSLTPGTPSEEEIEVVVTGERESGYNVPDATTATRTDTPLRDIPQSIQVVPRQVLEDQQAIRVTEALRNVSGVQRGNTIGNLAENSRIRGFTQFNSLRNGFRENSDVIRDSANLERIEVLKGPASVLYGNLEPGGIVSLVTKQPLSEPFYSVELSGGSFSFVRPTIDLSGPLNSERTLLYRLNAAYERDNGFRDFDQGIERVFVSPVLTWQISDRTDLTLDLEYLDYEQPFDRGLVAIGTGVADIPFDRILAEPDDVTLAEVFSTGYQLEHRFSENWTIRNAFRFSSRKNTVRNAEPDSLDDEQTGELTRTWFDVVDDDERYSLQTNLIGKLATGSVQHTLLLGIDLFRETNNLDYRLGRAPNINIFNPVYGTVRRPSRDELPRYSKSDTTTNFLGIYLQDQITLLDNLKLLVGGRFDIFDQESNNEGYFGDPDSQQQDGAFTPRIGIVYQPIQPLSLYASFSQSFAPNSGTTESGDLLEPERGTQYEVGIRGEFLDGQLSANLAAYHITKSNIATAVPNATFSVATGEQRSQGIELDITREILPGWNIIASYAYTDAKITEDGDSPNEGNIPFGVPFNAASLWTIYEIQSGDLQGLGFGLGLFYVGERQGDDDNSFQVPSYLRTDARIFYRRNNWQAAINFKNLFDVDYIEATQFRNAINPGAPFTVIGSFSIEF